MINKKGFSIILVIMIITISSLLIVVIVNKEAYLRNISENQDLKIKILKSINKKYNETIVDFVKNNTDSKWFSWWLDNYNSMIKLSWYIPNDWKYHNIFWVNKDIRNFINSSSSYKSSSNKKIWDVTSWNLFFETDNSFDLKIVEYDSNIYNTEKYLKRNSEVNISKNSSVSWYLQSDNTTFSSNSSKKSFDLSSKDYAFFVKSLTWVNYNAKFFDNSWSWVYINPLKYNEDNIEYFWYDILLNNWYYISKTNKILVPNNYE